MRKLLRRVRHLLQSRRWEADLAEEMEFHRAMAERDFGAENRRALGNLTQAREDARAIWLAPWLGSVWRDFAYGLRMLRRDPGFTLMALAALGSTIAINTSLFTVFNAVALRPWPRAQWA